MITLIVFSSLISLAFSAVAYFLSAYSLMCMGRKAGLRVDWMPYVPVARTLYRLQIVRQPWWKLFFVGGTSIACLTIITLIWGFIFGWTLSPTKLELIAIVPCLYIVAILFFTFDLQYRTFKVFGFNPYFAFATFAAPAAASVMYYIIAFSNLYEYVGLSGSPIPKKKEFNEGIAHGAEAGTGRGDTLAYVEPPTGNFSNTSSIICTAGAYKGGSFPIRDGEELVIGRDSSLSQIVVTSAAKVSRRHCGIRYSALDSRYIVTDYSSNGTFLEDGTRLNPMSPTPVPRGTVLIIGDRENQFKLF